MTWRVRDRATFRALASRPRHRRGPITLTTVSCEDGGPPRVAYAVSKRAGSAVARNRLRRRLRAAVAHHRGRMRPGTAYLFGAGSEAATANWTDVEVAVGDLIEWAARPGVGKGPHAPEEPGVGAPGGQAKPQRHSP